MTGFNFLNMYLNFNISRGEVYLPHLVLLHTSCLIQYNKPLLYYHIMSKAPDS